MGIGYMIPEPLKQELIERFAERHGIEEVDDRVVHVWENLFAGKVEMIIMYIDSGGKVEATPDVIEGDLKTIAPDYFNRVHMDGDDLVVV
tara:strand:+ start:520 stop:789 length:270 start_codon:yes stop_codon:yes gene_type:complete